LTPTHSQQCLQSTCLYGSSKINQHEIDIQDLTIQDSKLIFIPAWLASYYYRGSLYHILINGQNGHITAEHPPFP